MNVQRDCPACKARKSCSPWVRCDKCGKSIYSGTLEIPVSAESGKEMLERKPKLHWCPHCWLFEEGNRLERVDDLNRKIDPNSPAWRRILPPGEPRRPWDDF